jgi:cytoskeleton-associated protein 5
MCVLIDLQRKYKDYPSLPKLPNLIVKCLLKLSKIIEKLIDKLEVERVLASIHEYLLVVNLHEGGGNRSANDENGVKVVKTIINEIVKLRRDQVWEAYGAAIRYHPKPDHHIQKWIEIILKSLRGGAGGNASTDPVYSSTGTSQSFVPRLDQEINSIVDDLRNPEKFEATLPRLVRILNEHPEINLDNYLQ